MDDLANTFPKMRFNDLSAEFVATLLTYDAGTGRLFWRLRQSPLHGGSKEVRIFNAQFARKEAFTYTMPIGHRQGRIFRKAYLAHRVAWALAHGCWPSGDIDHINGDPGDNRLANLRDVPHAVNQRNMKRSAANSSGHVGVSYDRRRKKWRARVCLGGKDITIGRYDSYAAAVEARVEVSARLGFHANHGR